MAEVYASSGQRVFSHSRLLSRFFRLDPRCAERLGEQGYVVCVAHKVWLLDTRNKQMTVLQDSRDGFSNPLNLCSDGDAVYWGDYGRNKEHREVRIYKVGADRQVKVIHTFEAGTVRHIHNVVWDEAHRRFYVMTGDLEEMAGIYMADEDWKEVVPVVTGSQQYRAVVAFPCGDGLIYATDSVAEDNCIYLLKDGAVKALSPFPGSCIYGTETKDYYVFSSTVEPPEGRGALNMFTYKLGAGIQDRYAHLIAVRKSDLEVKELLRVKKDIWPMKLFQYGALTFPKGQEGSNELWYNIVACKGDGKTMRVTDMKHYMTDNQQITPPYVG